MSKNDLQNDGSNNSKADGRNISILFDSAVHLSNEIGYKLADTQHIKFGQAGGVNFG